MALGVHSSTPFTAPCDASDSDEPPLSGVYCFYRTSGDLVPEPALASPYRVSAWRPSLRVWWPGGTPDSRIKVRFLVRTVLYYLGLFANGECGAVCVYFGSRIVHYSFFTPKYWRFPFLPDEDLQIGDTWTDPSHRGKGLAGYVLARILVLKRKPGRHFWYVVEAINGPSIHVAERTGFQMAALGGWRKPFGIKLFGSYMPRVGTQGSDVELR